MSPGNWQQICLCLDVLMKWLSEQYSNSHNISKIGFSLLHNFMYHQTSSRRRTLIGNKIVEHSDVVGASPMLQLHLYSRLNTWLQWIGQRQVQDETENM